MDIATATYFTKLGWGKYLIPFLFFFLIEVQLIYNAVPISAVQHSDSVIYIYIFFFIFFSFMVYHRILKKYLFIYLVELGLIAAGGLLSCVMRTLSYGTHVGS